MTVLLVFVAIVAIAVGYIVYKAKKSPNQSTYPSLIDPTVMAQLETASKQVDGMIKKIDEVLADQPVVEAAPKPAKKKRRYYPKKK
jgi:hypothetical protein